MTRGEIWWADFGVPYGSEPGYGRPVLIMQHDDFNASNINTVIVLPLTSNLLLADAPGNVFLRAEDSRLRKDAVIVVSQLYAIEKIRLIEKQARIADSIMAEIEEGILLVLGIARPLRSAHY